MISTTTKRKSPPDYAWVDAAARAAIRPSTCPRCDGRLVRDCSAARLTYVCQGCATRWVCACPAL
jgi:hypothetical protein